MSSGLVQKTSFMSAALDQAAAAELRGEVPVGAVIARNGQIIASAGNQIIEHADPTAHAEMLAIRRATARIGSERLTDCDIYVTLEPCGMCAAAISMARIRRLYFGAADEKTGAVESNIRFFGTPICHHQPEVYSGIGEKEASAILVNFFANKRR
jgi:tRNA(adenine34) deaminase